MDGEKYPKPEGWEHDNYHDHPHYVNIAVYLSTGFVVFKNKDGTIRPIAFYKQGYYWHVKGRTRNGHNYNCRVHRLVWECKNNVILEKDDIIIDHINGNKDDNNICNLQLSNPRDNARNRKISKNNTSGIKGVSYHKLSNKWRADITNNENKSVSKLFENIDDAAKWRKLMEKKDGGYNTVSRC